MKCLYYPAPTLESTQRISDDLRTIGLNDCHLHVVSQDEAGLRRENIPSSNYLETLDLIRDGFIGTAVGFLAGIMGVCLLRYFAPFGPHLPNTAYVATLAAATLFGAWEGGLTGIATENRKLAPFHTDIAAGRYLILVYSPDRQEAAVRQMMRIRHPEALLAAIDRHFINPFRDVKRRSDASHPDGTLDPEE